MSSKCETVVIVREDHPNRLVEINKSDLKPEDVLYVEEKENVGYSADDIKRPKRRNTKASHGTQPSPGK